MKTLLALLLLIPSLSWCTELICVQDSRDDALQTFWKINTSTNKLTMNKAIAKDGSEIIANLELTIFRNESNFIHAYINYEGREEFYLNTTTGNMTNNFNSYIAQCSVNKKDSNLFVNENSNSDNFDEFKETCKSIGYKPETEKFADCVMKLYSDNKNSNKNKQISNNNPHNEYIKRQNQLLEQQNRIQQNQLNLQKKQHNKKAMDDFINNLIPKPKFNCRQVGNNTVCY